jgi:hypothetical protein
MSRFYLGKDLRRRSPTAIKRLIQRGKLHNEAEFNFAHFWEILKYCAALFLTKENPYTFK